MVKTRRTGKLTIRQRRIRYGVRKAVLAAAAIGFLLVLVVADRAGLFGTAPEVDLARYHGKACRVVKVIDGDTLDVDIPDGGYSATRIRLWGVDTPETVKPETLPQHFGPEASEFARALSFGKTVTLQLDHRKTRDKYGRLLAYVILPDGKMLNRLLVEQGYAYSDPRYEHRCYSEFRSLQRQAQKASRGLWLGVTNSDLPYYYRDKLKLP